MTPLPVAVCVGRCGGRNQVNTLFLDVLAIYFIHLDTGNFVKLVYWFLPNRPWSVLSPFVSRSGWNPQRPQPPEHHPVLRRHGRGSQLWDRHRWDFSRVFFFFFFKSASLSASSRRWFWRRSPPFAVCFSSEWRCGFYGRVRKCQRLQEGNTLMLLLRLWAGRIKRTYGSAGGSWCLCANGHWLSELTFGAFISSVPQLTEQKANVFSSVTLSSGGNSPGDARSTIQSFLFPSDWAK